MLLLKATQHQKTASPVANEPSTNQPSQLEPQKASESRRMTNASQTPPVPPSTSPIVQVLASTNSVAAKRLALWQAPIEFYGKVVDENTNPVAGAQVTFHWAEVPTELGNRTSTTESDANGLFSLRGQRGPDLSVSISKEGYYVSHRGQWGFHYALASDILSPDPQNPVIFQVQKKGQGVELVTSANGMQTSLATLVPLNGAPVSVDLLQQKVGASGDLELSQIKPDRSHWQSATNWSFHMSIPAGGFIEEADAFPLTAPETGYQTTVDLNFVKGKPDWTTQLSKTYYITFGQTQKYGWLRVEANITQQTVFLTYAINPDGSRNLEPK
jgi:hypothetical protein